MDFLGVPLHPFEVDFVLAWVAAASSFAVDPAWIVVVVVVASSFGVAHPFGPAFEVPAGPASVVVASSSFGVVHQPDPASAEAVAETVPSEEVAVVVASSFEGPDSVPASDPAFAAAAAVVDSLLDWQCWVQEYPPCRKWPWDREGDLG